MNDTLTSGLASERRAFAAVVVRAVLLTVAILLALTQSPAAEPSDRPHIVFILADDLGCGDVGCYGGTIAATPNIDRLAREGIRFTRYYSAAPICSPSRAGLITGQFPARWRLTSYLQTREGNRDCGQADFLDAAAPSLPRILQSAGYATGHFGKWHLGGGRDVTGAPSFVQFGYDEHAGTWESPQPHPDITATDWVWSPQDKVKRWERSAFFVDKTLDCLLRHKEQPCFINLWLDDPHTPWVPSAAAKGDTPENLRAVLTELDRQVGRLLDGLSEHGMEDRTLVIFASDNGALPTFRGSRSGGFRGSKLSLYEGGVRVPFIARWRGRIPAGRVDSETVLSAVDMLPTLCAFARAKHPEAAALDGEDMSAALQGRVVLRRKPLFWEYGRNETSFRFPAVKRDRSPCLAVLDGRWKLLANADGTGAQLFDVVADAGEANDVAGSQKEIVARLTKQLLDWRQSWPK